MKHRILNIYKTRLANFEKISMSRIGGIALGTTRLFGNLVVQNSPTLTEMHRNAGTQSIDFGIDPLHLSKNSIQIGGDLG